MPTLNYNPDEDIPDLTGKTIFITGGTYIRTAPNPKH